MVVYTCPNGCGNEVTNPSEEKLEEHLKHVRDCKELPLDLRQKVARLDAEGKAKLKALLESE